MATMIIAAPAMRAEPSGWLSQRPHAVFFSIAIVAPSASIQPTLPVPTMNISSMIAQQQPTQGREPPGYHTVYNVIRAIPEDLKTLAIDGEKAYRAAYDLVHRREAERPNQIWQADHTQLDLWAKRDDGKSERPWLTIVIDDHSRAIAGFAFSFDSPSALRTSLALRQAIWRKADVHWIVFGIPEVLYTDNGSDFTSTHLEQVAADIKLHLVFSTPGHPRGRGRIERFFDTVNQMFLCGLPGYIDHGAVRGEPSLTLTDLDRRFSEFLREYHARPPLQSYCGRRRIRKNPSGTVGCRRRWRS